MQHRTNDSWHLLIDVVIFLALHKTLSAELHAEGTLKKQHENTTQLQETCCQLAI